jgi:hypothetical protein
MPRWKARVCAATDPRASALVVRQRLGRRGSSHPGLDCYRRNDRGLGHGNLSDSGNVSRRKAGGTKEISGCAAIATSRVSRAAANSRTRIGFSCFGVVRRLPHRGQRRVRSEPKTAVRSQRSEVGFRRMPKRSDPRGSRTRPRRNRLPKSLVIGGNRIDQQEHEHELRGRHHPTLAKRNRVDKS